MSATNMNRRRALQGTAAVGALVLPAGVVAAPALFGNGSLAGTEQTDPHIAWWREAKAVRAEIYTDPTGNFPEALSIRETELEDLISTTVPTTPEGAAIVAALLFRYQTDMGEHAYLEPDQHAGATLARHILERTPADVLRRAGLEAQTA